MSSIKKKTDNFQKLDFSGSSFGSSSNKLPNDTDGILHRLKMTFGVETDTDLAKALNLQQGSISKAKQKRAVPPSWITTVALSRGVSADWLLTGKGQMFLGGAKIATPKQALDLANGRIPRADPLREDEPGPHELGGLDREYVRMAIEAVEEGLKATNRELSPEKKAALVLAAYDLIEESGTTEKVTELIRIVA